MARRFEIFMDVLLKIWVLKVVEARRLLDTYNNNIKEFRFFETSVNIYESTWRNSLEYYHILQQDLCPSATSICEFVYGLASNDNNTVSNRPVNPTDTPGAHLLLSSSFRLTTAPLRNKTLRFSFNLQKETAVKNKHTGDYKQRSLASCADFKL
jgi:hypothetical protein